MSGNFPLLCYGLLALAYLAMGKEVVAKNGTKLGQQRFNLNFNEGLAQATGEDGSTSVSHGSSFGFNAGILSHGKYSAIDSKTAANSESIGIGEKPPTAFIDTAVNNTPGHGVGGAISGGYSGGNGSVKVNSISEQYKIHLFGDTVLLRNLNMKNESETTTAKPKNNEKLYLD